MDFKYMELLLKECHKAESRDEVPVAALIVDEKGKIIAKSYNKREKFFLTINHCEIMCIIKANKRMKNKILDKCSLYVTLEPCEMCKSVIREARIKNVYYLLSKDPQKKQYSKSIFKNINIDNCIREKYQQILSNFFKKKR